MKKPLLFSLFLLSTLAFFLFPKALAGIKSGENDKAYVAAKEQLRHVVLFKFNESSSPAEIRHIENAFLELPLKIPQIRDFEWGINNSPEGLDKGFTHCFFLTFDSEEDRAVYLPHPDHKAFGALLGPHLEDVLVVDYWTGR